MSLHTEMVDGLEAMVADHGAGPAATVMVVDDDVTTRLLAREALEESGFHVEEVAAGDKALARIKEVAPDAVVLDVLMPGMNGFEICAGMQADPDLAGIPILMMTSLDDLDSVRKAYRSGATEFSTKPVNWAVEAHRIQYMLRSAAATREARKARETWERTFNAIDDVVMILDADLRVVRANTASCQTLAQREVEGRHCYELFQGRDAPCDGCPVMETLQSGQAAAREIEYSKPGSTFLVSSAPLLDIRGGLSHVVYLAKDISERKAIEAQFMQAQKMEAVGTLAGGIAHDFNNLLQTIIGYGEILKESLAGQAEASADLEEMVKAANRGNGLTRQLLTASRRLESKCEPICLADQVEGVVGLLRRTLPKTVEVRTFLDPATDLIEADAGQVEQILMNMAVNAGHAMPDGGQLIFETANCKMGENYCNTHTGAKPGDYVLLSISDTGHGMNEEVRSRIFEPFFTTKKLGEGTGLGLALSYGIVKNHGGYITCYSEVGAGTTFKIYFPAAQNPSGSGRQGHSAAQEAPAPGGKETILIVEDEAAIRKLAARLLGSVGYRVLEASDGLDALEVYERYRDEISLVVLDIMMPRLDGLKCLAGLKRINPGVKALIASGYSPTISAHNAEEAGAQGFLSKPYDREAMLRQVRQVLDRVA